MGPPKTEITEHGPPSTFDAEPNRSTTPIDRSEYTTGIPLPGDSHDAPVADVDAAGPPREHVQSHHKLQGGPLCSDAARYDTVDPTCVPGYYYRYDSRTYPTVYTRLIDITTDGATTNERTRNTEHRHDNTVTAPGGTVAGDGVELAPVTLVDRPITPVDNDDVDRFYGPNLFVNGTPSRYLPVFVRMTRHIVSHVSRNP